VEKSVKDEQSIRQFLKGMYGGKGPGGEVMFVPEKGVIPENLEKVGDNQLLNGEVSDDLLSFCGQRRRIKRNWDNLLCERKITYAGTRVASRRMGRRLLSESVAKWGGTCMRDGSGHRRSACSMGYIEIDCIALFQKEHLTLEKR
jgi:hypothetical protein